jgi:predicted nucleic acid-binding protein
MKIVVDANVVISAAIVPGRTREVLLLADAIFLAPPELEAEVQSYSSLLAEKSGLDEPDVQEIVELLFDAIGTVPSTLPQPRCGRPAQRLQTNIPTTCHISPRRLLLIRQ